MRQQHVPFLRDMVAMRGEMRRGRRQVKWKVGIFAGDEEKGVIKIRNNGWESNQKLQEREQVAFCWAAGWNPVAMTLPLDPSAFWPLATCEMPRMLGTATPRSVLPLPQNPNFPYPTFDTLPLSSTLIILPTSCVVSCPSTSRRFFFCCLVCH